MKITQKLRNIYRADARIARFLTVLLCTGLSYGFYRGIQDNYLAEVVHITSFERGIVEFFRELPGLLVVFILAVMYRLSEARVFKVALVIMLGGITGLLFGGAGKAAVVLWMMIYSVGEHVIMPVRSGLSLSLAKPGEGGSSLGVTGALGHLGNISGYLLVALVFAVCSRLGFGRADFLPYRVVFVFAVLWAALAVILGLPLKEEETGRVQRRRFYFARKFFKYYMLEVFYGSRKQIFLTFAPYVLILQYGAGAGVISVLLAVCAAFGILASPLMGKLIDRLGYKVIMVSDTLVLIVVCLLYGFAHRLFAPRTAFIVVCVNFVLDSIISLASMASSVYVQDIADSQQEVSATLSTGVSVNHFVSVLIALAGGWIWAKTGIEVLFSLSALLGICNSLYAASIKPGR